MSRHFRPFASTRPTSQFRSGLRARTDELEQANAALHDASMIDPLTGLKNRRFLGLSMASWNFLISAGLAIFSLLAAKRPKDARAPSR